MKKYQIHTSIYENLKDGGLKVAGCSGEPSTRDVGKLLTLERLKVGT
jgi:hypothetical protein